MDFVTLELVCFVVSGQLPLIFCYGAIPNSMLVRLFPLHAVVGYLIVDPSTQ